MRAGRRDQSQVPGVAGVVASGGRQCGVSFDTVRSLTSSQLPPVCGVGYSDLHQQSRPSTTDTSTQPPSTPQAVTPLERVIPPQAATPEAGREASVSNHVLQTDRATGQVEELTPLNSPRSSLPSLGDILNEPTSDPAAGSGSGQQSSQPQELCVLQQSLCGELQCPLPLPGWLVAGMARVQGMTSHTPSAPWNCRKRGRKG